MIEARPKSIEDISTIVREANGPIYFGQGNSQDGPPSPLRDYLLANKKFVLDQIRASTDSEESSAISLDPPPNLSSTTRLSLSNFDNILDYSPQDQVIQVQVGAGIDGIVLREEDGSLLDLSSQSLQGILREEGQCLPFAMPILQPGENLLINQSGGLVGRGIALNLPHPLQAQCGSWRDWILGATLVLADGTIVKCGSKAVKNVAGYDLHKFMVGTRDTLAILVDVTLKTYPLDGLPKPDIVFGPLIEDQAAKGYGWTQRVQNSDFEACLAGASDSLMFADRMSSTLWCQLDNPDAELPRYPGDWVIRSGCGAKNLQINDPAQIKLMKRAKAVFDPTNKLNPGEWGFM